MHLKILLILFHKYRLLRMSELKLFKYYYIYSYFSFYCQLLLDSCKKDTVFTTSIWNFLFWAHVLYWGGRSDTRSSYLIKGNYNSSASNWSFRWEKGVKVFAPWSGCRRYASPADGNLAADTRWETLCCAFLAGKMELKVSEDSLGEWE